MNNIRAADAKLLLWPEQDEEEFLSSHLHESKRKKEFDGSTSAIHDRLRHFRHVDDTLSQSKTSTYISPAKYISLMLRYFQNQVSTLSSYLYSTENKSTAQSAYSLFRQTQYQNMIAEPKDAWEGLLSAFTALKTGYVGGMQYLVDGVYEFGCSSISACTALLPSKSGNHYAPLSAFLLEFGTGLSKGAEHAKDGLVLFAAGAVVGARNLMVGIARTPEAIKSSRLGMLYYPTGRKEIDGNPYSEQHRSAAVWDYYSLDDEDKEIQMEEARLKVGTDAPKVLNKKPESLRKRRRSVPVKDSKFYDILGVSTNANVKEIRSAYRREALRRHPDKQQTTSTDLDETSQSTTIEGFLDLTEAYRILSNDASRDAYDEYGVCYRNHSGDSFQAEAAQDLISELFGADSVKNYVGHVQIASIVNEVFGFASPEEDKAESTEVMNLRQRRRIVDIAKYLRSRVSAFVRGEISPEQFTDQCRKEVKIIFQEGGDADFVALIGRTLSQEADRRLGHVLPFVKRVSSDFAHVVSSKVASAKVYGPIYFRVALEGMVSGSYYDKNDTDEDCNNDSRSSRHPVDQDAILDLLWQYISNDSIHTLREACGKVFADQGVRDGSLAFVKTQSLLKFQRAEAVQILGREFLAAAERERK